MRHFVPETAFRLARSDMLSCDNWRWTSATIDNAPAEWSTLSLLQH